LGGSIQIFGYIIGGETCLGRVVLGILADSVSDRNGLSASGMIISTPRLRPAGNLKVKRRLDPYILVYLLLMFKDWAKDYDDT
jgi:hypothetical protein